jgi:hypothetical protein
MVKLKFSIALNGVLLGVVAFFLLREESRRIDRALDAHYFPKQKPVIFEAPQSQALPPKFDYALHQPNQFPEATR